MSDFLYCHNPLDEDFGEYILHLPQPNALIKVILLEEQDAIESDEFVHKSFVYDDGDIVEEYQFVFTPFAPLDKSVYTDEIITGILDEAWEYWVDVLQWEDNDDDDDDFE